MTDSAAIALYCRQLRSTLRLTLFMILMVAAGSAVATGTDNSLFGNDNRPEFLPVDEALPFTFSTDDGAIVLSWDIAPHHYLYRGRIRVTPVTPAPRPESQNSPCPVKP